MRGGGRADLAKPCTGFAPRGAPAIAPRKRPPQLPRTLARLPRSRLQRTNRKRRRERCSPWRRRSAPARARRQRRWAAGPRCHQAQRRKKRASFAGRRCGGGGGGGCHNVLRRRRSKYETLRQDSERLPLLTSLGPHSSGWSRTPKGSRPCKVLSGTSTTVLPTDGSGSIP